MVEIVVLHSTAMVAEVTRRAPGGTSPAQLEIVGARTGSFVSAASPRRADAAVAAAYGWPADLPDKDVLSRLLELNHRRSTQQAQAVSALQDTA